MKPTATRYIRADITSAGAIETECFLSCDAALTIAGYEWRGLSDTERRNRNAFFVFRAELPPDLARDKHLNGAQCFVYVAEIIKDFLTGEQ